MNRILALAALTLPLCACAQTGTIRELGHPEFEPVVGAETELERVDPEQTGSMDAFPDTVDREADHRWVFAFWPAGSEASITIQIRAARKEQGGLPLTHLAAAVYPLSQQQAAEYGRRGVLPAPDQPLKVEVASQPIDEEKGLFEVVVEVPRAAIPAGTEKLAVPILARFRDGWVRVHFYQTGIPAVAPAPPAEEPPPSPGPGGEAPGSETPPTPDEPVPGGETPAAPPPGDGER